MHFFTRTILPTDLWDQRKHHKLFTQSRDIFECANTNVDIFYTTSGRRPSKEDIVQVNSLVTRLQKAKAALQQKSELSSDPKTRAKVGERDYDYIIKWEKKLTDWLEKITKVQEKLQKQVDAETWFQEEEERKSREHNRSSTEYLNDKPLPPIRQGFYQFVKRSSKVSVVPAEKETEAGEALSFLNNELSPIIDSYCERRTKLTGSSLYPDIARSGYERIRITLIEKTVVAQLPGVDEVASKQDLTSSSAHQLESGIWNRRHPSHLL